MNAQPNLALEEELPVEPPAVEVEVEAEEEVLVVLSARQVYAQRFAENASNAVPSPAFVP
ncbi:MAG: hypothetical protein IT310_02875 [Anaerolineales bacterium]|nr:hypothetical protein [Anaerolineales bacterium]